MSKWYILLPASVGIIIVGVVCAIQEFLAVQLDAILISVIAMTAGGLINLAYLYHTKNQEER